MAPKKILTDYDFLNISRLLNVPLPTDAGDAVNKAYIDNLALQIAQSLQGLSWKEDVVVAADANIDPAAPGTAIDGETLADGDRVLLMGQTAAAENGIYVLAGTALERAADADTGEELTAAVVAVAKGTYAGETFRQSEVDLTVDVDPNLWVPFHTAVPLATETIAGIIRIATQPEVDAGLIDDAAVTPLKLQTVLAALEPPPATVGAYAGDVPGDGALLDVPVVHGLGSTDVTVSVKEIATNEEVETAVTVTDDQTVTLGFSIAPAAGAYRATVIAALPVAP